MQAVIIPFHDYKLSLEKGFRTRDAHIYSNVIDNQLFDTIVIVNRPTLLLETLLKKKRLWTGGKSVYYNGRMRIQQFSEHLYVIDIIDLSILKPVLFGKSFIGNLYYRNRLHIREALNILSCDNFITYESSPLTRKLVQYLSPKKKIFDGVDNLCKHDTYSDQKQHLLKEYYSILDGYDKVFFNSMDSIEYFNCADRNNVRFLANGVDHERFTADYPSPIEYRISKEKNRIIAVYTGKMQSMFDTELVKVLASDNPDVDFFFLGSILSGEPNKALSHFRNIFFIGDVHYDLMPSYITHSNICIIPYLTENQHGGDPIKFYEYYASGKPIISTNIGCIKRYHDNTSVFIVSRKDFPKTFMAAKYLGNYADRAVPENISWNYISREIFSCIR